MWDLPWPRVELVPPYWQVDSYPLNHQGSQVHFSVMQVLNKLRCHISLLQHLLKTVTLKFPSLLLIYVTNDIKMQLLKILLEKKNIAWLICICLLQRITSELVTYETWRFLFLIFKCIDHFYFALWKHTFTKGCVMQLMVKWRIYLLEGYL